MNPWKRLQAYRALIGIVPEFFRRYSVDPFKGPPEGLIIVISGFQSDLLNGQTGVSQKIEGMFHSNLLKKSGEGVTNIVFKENGQINLRNIEFHRNRT
jgi:hypothetical protein